MRMKEYPELAGVIYGCCQDDFDDTSVVVRRWTGYVVRRNKFIYNSDLRKRWYESFSIKPWIRLCARSNVSNGGLSILAIVDIRVSVSRLT